MKYPAQTIKPFRNLNDKRIIAKFEIERQYWSDSGVDCGIRVTTIVCVDIKLY
ncbi:hypothetical protein I7822_04860 [Metabacillus sp. BG109]|uniref:Uncharacterized protein n=1 Tax=Metabacillus bambusae TaxID=2795218 RepID=A0ABS3MYD5_9BACI|nr:hypothetical protein [Metabacillus bambusae]